jgi:hypothetical protein
MKVLIIISYFTQMKDDNPLCLMFYVFTLPSVPWHLPPQYDQNKPTYLDGAKTFAVIRNPYKSYQ